MIDYFRKIFENDAFAPHGICLLWQPELVWTHVISDALIAGAYFSIPLALAYFLAKRPDVPFNWVAWCFVIFITACGLTHVFSIWTLWNPDYGVEALIKLMTAIASVATAIALWPLLPVAIALPSPEQLRQANQILQNRIDERDAALKALEHETAERMKAEEKLRQAQKMEAIGQLTGGIAHDFNNLLTIVRGGLERIERYTDPENEKVLKAAVHSLEGVERAATLTHQLLAFARKQTLNTAIFDVNDVVRHVLSLSQRLIGPEINIHHDLTPEAAPVEVDCNQLENALINLIINARDAMPEGGTLTLTTKVQARSSSVNQFEDQEDVIIEVMDTGAGMSEEVRQQAFDPFFTTKPIGQGSGLGLSQVHGFIQQSHGSIVIESVIDQGTCVRLRLPKRHHHSQTEMMESPL